MKKAYLVRFEVVTRVVVDIPDNLSRANQEEETAEQGIVKAQENFRKNGIPEYINIDNLVDFEEDTEVPYQEGE